MGTEATTAATAGAASDAAMTSTILQASAPRREEDSAHGLPWAAIALMIGLIAAAGLARIYGRGSRAREPGSARGRGLSSWFTRAAVRARGAPDLSVRTSLPLGRDTQLHVVRWADRELLVSTGGASGAVVLDRRSIHDEGMEHGS